MNPNTPRNNHSGAKQRRWPGQTYWIILFTTVVLLIAFTASFFVLLLLDGEEDYSDFDPKVPEDTYNKTTSSSATIKEPLYVTEPTRDNYIPESSSHSQQISSLIQSNNSILVELGSYQAIAEKDADEKIYPASMTKVMSLLVICENIKSLDEKLTVTEKIADYAEKNEGSGYGLKVGETLTVEDLLYLTSYQSDTIAVLMLADHVAGSEEKFVELMNEKVEELKLENTHFSNCTGLHEKENYTTCREMAAIMAYALDNSLCRELLTSYEGYRLITNLHPKEDKCTFYSTWYSGRFKDNPRLETVTVKGGKTGYTDEAGVCLVSYAESNSTDKCYINVIVGKPKGSGLNETESTKDVKFIYNNYAE